MLIVEQINKYYAGIIHVLNGRKNVPSLHTYNNLQHLTLFVCLTLASVWYPPHWELSEALSQGFGGGGLVVSERESSGTLVASRVI